MRRSAGVIVLAVIAGVASWFFGIGILPAVVVTLVVFSIGTVLRLVAGQRPNRDWPLPPSRKNDGQRRDAAELSWALRTRGGIVDDRVIARVRSIAARRLALRHLDLDDPAHRAKIQRLIGAASYETLTSGSTRKIRVTTVLGMLDTLDTLVRHPETRGSNTNPNSEKQA